ncbi:LysM peptidoglycan-binding domain-containing protein [Mycolicibacter kumamotonensis]|nr:LysM peptidoglycan-binding domain-containing protein [Mycolicibacter kumamotonensis]
MNEIPRLAVRSPQPFDIVGDSFVLCGLGGAFEGVVGTATLTDRNGTILTTVAPMFVPNTGFGYTLFDFPVSYPVPATTEGMLIVHSDNPSGLPENDFTVSVPLTFGRPLLGGPFHSFSLHRVVSGDTLFKIAQDRYGDGDLWQRLFIANRDRIDNPDLIRIGQLLRIP